MTSSLSPRPTLLCPLPSNLQADRSGKTTFEDRVGGSLRFFPLLFLPLKTVMIDREREIWYDIPYMWNLKRNDTNELA